MKLLYGSQFNSLISQMPENTSTTSSVTVKLSGDGALFSRTAQFTLLSFSFPDLSTENALSCYGNVYIESMTTLCTGNYTFAAVKEGENFLVIKEAFAPVLEEINNLIAAGKVLVDCGEVPLQFIFGSDYKVHTNPFNSLLVFILPV